MKVHQQQQQVVNVKQQQPRAFNVLARRKMVRNTVGSMQAKQPLSKRPLLQQAHQRKEQVLQQVEGVAQRQNREVDAPEPQRATDIVGNTEDEKEDL